MAEQISEQTKDTLHYLDGILHKYPTMEFLRKAVVLIRAQAEEIERLCGAVASYEQQANRDAQEIKRLRSTVKDLQRVVAQQTLRGVTEREIDDWGMGRPRLVSPDEIKRKLRSKGLLIEDAPQAPESVSPTTFIGGVRMDTMKRIPTVAEMQGILKEDAPSPTRHRDFMTLPVEERRKQMEAQCTDEMVKHYEEVNAENDPLKIDPNKFITRDAMDMAAKHNALVDEVRELLLEVFGLGVERCNRISKHRDEMDRLWAEIRTLEEKVNAESKMNYDTYAESIELHTERIIALEQQLCAHLGKEAE